MHVFLKAPPELRSATLRDYVGRRARFALGRFADAIGTVTVTVEDVNGIRGGIDKKVSILVRVPNQPEISVRAVHEDAYAASDIAMGKARRALVRRRDRRPRTVGLGRGGGRASGFASGPAAAQVERWEEDA